MEVIGLAIRDEIGVSLKLVGCVQDVYEQVEIETVGEVPHMEGHPSCIPDVKFSPSIGRSFELVALSTGAKIEISRLDFDITYRGSTMKQLLKYEMAGCTAAKSTLSVVEVPQAGV